MRKGESENVVEVFKNQLNANLIYKDVTDRFLDKLAGVADPEELQDEECKYDLLPQLGDAPRFANRLDHVTSPRPFRQLPRLPPWQKRRKQKPGQ